MFASINPATGETFATWEQHTTGEVAAIIDRAHRAQQEWAAKTVHDRCEVLRHLARALVAQPRQDEMARWATREMGKPIVEALTEVQKCATACEFYANNAARFLEEDVVSTQWARSSVVYQPLGLVLSIMPWNFPYWQFFRFAAPALAAGNGLLLKHAPTVFGCAHQIVRVCHEAGLPDGLIGSLRIGTDAVPDVIANEGIAAVTFTGSTVAGAAVAGMAARSVKKCVLELGGSDPYLVLADADVELATRACLEGRMINSGQSCIAAKRWIVHEAVYDTFRERMKIAVEALRVGDPLDVTTHIGPLARADIRDTLAAQVATSVLRGATVLANGGGGNNANGFFHAPMVLENVVPGMPAFDEELFGPVAALIRATSTEHALELANATVYGLGAAVFTSSSGVARDVALQLQCGQVFINAYVRSDARLPFGGVKQSGYGRELGALGIREFVNAKTIVQ